MAARRGSKANYKLPAKCHGTIPEFNHLVVVVKRNGRRAREGRSSLLELVRDRVLRKITPIYFEGAPLLGCRRLR